MCHSNSSWSLYDREFILKWVEKGKRKKCLLKLWSILLVMMTHHTISVALRTWGNAIKQNFYSYSKLPKVICRNNGIYEIGHCPNQGFLKQTNKKIKAYRDNKPYACRHGFNIHTVLYSNAQKNLKKTSCGVA